jgi:outer membrane protein TolC
MHRIKLISCCLGLVLGSTLVAQEKAYIPPPRAIEALVAQALANNAELRVFEAQVTAAKGQRTQAGFFKNVCV